MKQNSRECVLSLFGGAKPSRIPCMPITMQLAADLINVPYYDYATDHRKLVQAQIAVCTEFGFDHVSCISDPGREASDCGAKIIYAKDSPPAIDNTANVLADKSRLATLRIPDPAAHRMGDRVNAAALFKKELGNEKLIEGWVEGPCAQGADLRGLDALMFDFFEEESFVRDLFGFSVEMATAFAKAQIQAGADIIGVGDAAESLIGPKFYNEFVWPYEKQLIDAIHAAGAGVRLHICGDTRAIFEGIGKLNCELVDVDYLTPMSHARTCAPNQILTANLNPVAVVQDGTPESIWQELHNAHTHAGARFVCGAGCEITRTTSHANIMVLREYATKA